MSNRSKNKRSVFEIIQEWYWKLVPYDWRPEEIWYKFKCWAWHRYTTVKPRTLKFHTWCDKTALIPHVLFEMLSDFLESECSPSHVDWYGSGHKVVVSDTEKYVIDELWDIYYWWHNIYLPKEELIINPWYDFLCLHTKKEDVFSFDPKWDSPENKKIGDKLFKRMNNKEATLNKDLEKYMIRLIKCHKYMWT